MNYSDYTIQISTEPSYYGSDCTQSDANRIAAALGDLVKAQFPGINVDLWMDGRGSSRTTGPDMNVVDEINHWVSQNWTAAL